MSKRKAAWSIGCLITATVAVVVLLYIDSDAGRFDRIRVGMTLSDVEYIMGAASFDSHWVPEPGEGDQYGALMKAYPAEYRFPDNTKGVVHQWRTSKRYIYVMFGSDNRVRDKLLVDHSNFQPNEPDLWDRIASWFR